MKLREYWFTVLCIYITGVTGAVLLSVFRDLYVWGHFTLLEYAFWAHLAAFNVEVWTLTYAVTCAFIVIMSTALRWEQNP